MEGLEVSGKTVDEAIQSALAQLGLTREEVKVEVIKRGKPGFLGLGAEEATVRVTPLSEAEKKDEVGDIAKEVLERLLSLMKITGKVELKQIPSQGAGAETIALDIKGEDLGILIGRRGQTLASLQYIVQLIVSHRLKTRKYLTVDVEGYKQRRYQALRELALSLAQKVARTGVSITLEPMPANERRIIHLALSGSPNVLTQSVGDGDVRKVVIQPRKKGSIPNRHNYSTNDLPRRDNSPLP